MSPIKKILSLPPHLFHLSSLLPSLCCVPTLTSFLPTAHAIALVSLFLAAQSGRRMQRLSRTPLRLWQVLRISLGEFRFFLDLGFAPHEISCFMTDQHSARSTQMTKTLRRTCVLTFKCAYGEQNRATTKLTQSHYGEIQFRLLKPARLLGTWLFRLNLKQKHCTARCKYMAR